VTECVEIGDTGDCKTACSRVSSQASTGERLAVTEALKSPGELPWRSSGCWLSTAIALAIQTRRAGRCREAWIGLSQSAAGA
jgi:hypothetical protein